MWRVVSLRRMLKLTLKLLEHGREGSMEVSKSYEKIVILEKFMAHLEEKID